MTPTPSPPPQGGGEQTAFVARVLVPLILILLLFASPAAAEDAPRQTLTIGSVEIAGDPRYEPVRGADRIVLKTRAHPYPGAEVSIDDAAPLEKALATFAETYQSASTRMLAGKLGLVSLERVGDDALVSGLAELLQAVETDMTLFFRLLADVPMGGDGDPSDDAVLVAPLRRAFYTEDAFAPEHTRRLADWLRRYATRARLDGLPAAERVSRMNRVNPKYVLRNYLAQLVIDALERGDASVMERLMKVLQRPFDEQPEHDELAERRPEWARNRPGCSALSCSS